MLNATSYHGHDVVDFFRNQVPADRGLSLPTACAPNPLRVGGKSHARVVKRRAPNPLGLPLIDFLGVAPAKESAETRS